MRIIRTLVSLVSTQRPSFSSNFCIVNNIVCVSVMFAIIMPIIPTIEYISEKKTFQDSRKDSFYYKGLNEVALVNYLNFTNEIDLIDSIGSPNLTMTFTWAMIAPYFSTIFIIIALILFICAGKKTKESDSQSSEPGSKANSGSKTDQKNEKEETSNGSKGGKKRLKSLTESEKIPPHQTVPAKDGRPTIYGYGSNRREKIPPSLKSENSKPKTQSEKPEPSVIEKSNSSTPRTEREKPSTKTSSANKSKESLKRGTENSVRR